MSTLARRKRIKELREAGARAFAEGKHLQTNPEKYMDHFQWAMGYNEARREAVQNQVDAWYALAHSLNRYKYSKDYNPDEMLM